MQSALIRIRANLFSAVKAWSGSLMGWTIHVSKVVGPGRMLRCKSTPLRPSITRMHGSANTLLLLAANAEVNGSDQNSHRTPKIHEPIIGSWILGVRCEFRISIPFQLYVHQGLMIEKGLTSH